MLYDRTWCHRRRSNQRILEKETDAWKDVNEECLYPTTIPMPPVMPILNLTRVSDVIYKDQDNYTNPGDGLKDFVSSLLIEPVPL